MLLSNMLYLVPISLFVFKRKFIFVPLLLGTCLASSYYHICFENYTLPWNYIINTTTKGWLFYDQFKCYDLSPSYKTFLVLLDYVFANTSSIGGLLMLLPLTHIKNIGPTTFDNDSLSSNTNRNSKQQSLHRSFMIGAAAANDDDRFEDSIKKKKEKIEFDIYWIESLSNYYRNGFTIVGFMLNVAVASVLLLMGMGTMGTGIRHYVWIMNVVTFLYLLFVFSCYIIRLYVIYSFHMDHKHMGYSTFLSLLWSNVFKKYYTTFFYWQWLIVSLSLAFIGLILWSVLQRLLSDWYYIWIHPLWHDFTAVAMLLLGVSIKTQNNLYRSIS